MRFKVWAPEATEVAIEADGVRQHMRSGGGGWWQADVPDASHGTDYGFVLDGGSPRPDPRSRWQPYGPHRPSRVYDHGRYTWADDHWRGVQLAGSIIYELHLGTFTEAGTFDA